MKPLYLLLVIPLLAISCGRQNGQDFDIPERKEFSDSIKNANYSWVADRTDSLQKVALAIGDSLSWAYYRNERATMYYYTGQFDSVPLIADRLISWGTRQKDPKKVRQLLKLAYRLKGGYFQQYDFIPDSAIICQRKAMEFSSPADHKDYIVSMANLADAYKLDARYAEAADIYCRAVLFADSVGMEPRCAEMVYSGLAGVYSAMGDFREAQKWWDKTMELYPYMDSYARFANLNNLGNHYYKARKYGKSLRTFIRLDSFLDSIRASDWTRNFCRINLADVYMRLGQTERSGALLDSVTPYFEETAPGSAVLAQLHNLKMRQAVMTGNAAEVERLLTQHPLADSIRNEQLENRLETMEFHYSNSGQWHKAYDTHIRLQAHKDSVASAEIQQILGARRLAYERDTKVLALQTDNASKQARILRLWTILGFSLLALTVLVAWVAIYRLRNRRHEEKMYRKIMDLRVESVRTRITPHFIYNLLNQELLAMKRGGDSRLPVIVSLLRHQQVVGDRIMVSLAEELDFLRDYVEVQSMRSDSVLQYQENIEVAIDTNKILFPSMLLQILAENAFKHGFPGLPAGTDCRLWLDISSEASKIVVRLTNNCPVDGEGRTLKQCSGMDSNGLGLRIITETLAYVNSQGKYNFKFSLHPDPGFCTAEIQFNDTRKSNNN